MSGGRRWPISASPRASLLLALGLLFHPGGAQGWTHVDALNTPLVVLSFVIGLTTAVYSCGAVAAEQFDALRLRAYHVAFQVFMGAQALALLADNMGVMWVAIEIATMASVLMVAVHGTPPAIEAAWKLFILCGVGITLALLGTIILYLAAQPLVGHGDSGLSWTVLRGLAERADPGVLNLAFVFLLVGYGTKAGLVPLHSWLPDAEAEGPIAISAVLSGLLLNAALHAVLRAKASSARMRGRWRRGASCWRSASPPCCWPVSPCGGGGMRGASSPGAASSTWGWRPSPSASAGRRRTWRGCCTCWGIRCASRRCSSASARRRSCAGRRRSRISGGCAPPIPGSAGRWRWPSRRWRGCRPSPCSPANSCCWWRWPGGMPG